MKSKKAILLTGATGFIGQRYIFYNKENYVLLPLSLQNVDISSISLKNINSIVHLAGKAHQMQKIDDKVYFDVNYRLTLLLAERAKEQGVQQFIFMSTVKVYGQEDTLIVLNETSDCHPIDAYGKSKLQAEQALQALEDDTFKVSIIRTPLVYGAGVKGNMIRLLKLTNSHFFLPFKGIENERSMVYIDNLIELINTIIDRKASGVFIAGDKHPISTSFLIRVMYEAFGRRPSWFAIPSSARKMLKYAKPDLENRLFGCFVIDNTITNQKLCFEPPYTTEYGIRQMVEWFKNIHNA